MSQSGISAEASVAEAAAAVGLTRARVHALIRAGELPARKVGNQYVVDTELLRAMPRRPGRPLSMRMAWSLLMLADGQRPAWATPGDVRRVERHLERLAAADVPELLLQALVRRRARRHLFHAARPHEALDSPELLPAGVSDPRAGLAAGAAAEAYVHDDDLPLVVRRHLLVEAGRDRANVWLHASPFVPPASLALQVAADLTDRGGPRERARARDLIITAVGAGR